MSDVERLARADFEAVSSMLRASGLEVDLEAELSREMALPWVVRSSEGRQPVAFCLAWDVQDELHLLDMVTHPEHRRRGHARTLLGALLGFARTTHKRLLLLEVRQSNRAALALYESYGFERAGVRRGYYSDTGEDAIEMRLTFEANAGEAGGAESPRAPR